MKALHNLQSITEKYTDNNFITNGEREKNLAETNWDEVTNYKQQFSF